jgi:hypothetical protein
LARDLLLVAARAAEGASKPCRPSACFSAWVFMTAVYLRAVLERVDALASASGLVCTMQVEPASRTAGRGTRHLAELPGGVDVQQRERRRRRAKAFCARRSSTELSLPIEYSITGRSNSATTSRRMWMLSASRRVHRRPVKMKDARP